MVFTQDQSLLLRSPHRTIALLFFFVSMMMVAQTTHGCHILRIVRVLEADSISCYSHS